MSSLLHYGVETVKIRGLQEILLIESKKFRNTSDLNLAGISLKELQEGMGWSIGHLLSTFDTIHTIDLIFGTYNELPLCFQLSETTWCPIGFHSYHSTINDVTNGRHLGFLNIQILFIFELNVQNGKKTAFSDWNL